MKIWIFDQNHILAALEKKDGVVLNPLIRKKIQEVIGKGGFYKCSQSSIGQNHFHFHNIILSRGLSRDHLLDDVQEAE